MIIRKTNKKLGILLLVSFLLCGCGEQTPANPSEVPTKTPTPTITLAPVPTDTPVPTMTPENKPTPEPAFDVSAITGGGVNAMAEFTDGELTRTASVAPGSVIYANNMDFDKGNEFAGSSYSGAEFILSDGNSHSGKYAIKVNKRKKQTQGISGSGITLDSANGLDYDSLIGHTVSLRCFLYYGTDSFGVSDELTFALYDAYRRETIEGYEFSEKANDIVLDSEGNPVLREMEAPVLLGTCTVPKGCWTECTFTFRVEEATEKNGLLFLGTKGEAFNSLGVYTPFLIDDLTITVVE